MIGATVTQLTFNSPADGDVSQDAFRLLNLTIYNNNTSQGIDVIIYGSNDSVIPNNSIIYRRANVTNGTTITFNWTSPKIRGVDDQNIVLLMYFDNQTGEYANNFSVDNNMVLLYRMDNSSDFGENESLVYDFSNARHNGTVSAGVVNSSGRFSKALQFNTTNNINAGNPLDFNITNGLTLEGWFYPFGNGKGVGVDSFVFDAVNGQTPSIIHINGTIYAIAYTGAAADGFVSTVNISSNGTITPTIIDTLEFDITNGDDPKIIKTSDEIYAIAYTGAAVDGFVTTINITNSGIISNSVLSSFEFDIANGQTPDIIFINGTIYAIAYTGVASDGFISTINISSNGTITQSVLSTLEFDINNGDDPEIIKISNDVYAVTYTGAGANGFITTLNITNNGTIKSTVLSSYQFYTAGGFADPNIIFISGDMYAIAHTGTGGNGFVSTLNISSNGTITPSVIDTLEFDIADCSNPSIVNVSDDIYSIAYTGTAADGFVNTIRIFSNGTIFDNVLDVFEFDAVNGLTPDIMHISGDASEDLYAIAYAGTGTAGVISTVNIATDNGISKKRAYKLYANSTTAFGGINGQTLTGSLVSGWNHLALVYNKSLASSQQKLYINGRLASSGNLTEDIKTNTFNVLIGNNFNGLLDDVAIYNRTLSLDEIKEHAGIKIIDETGLNNGTGIYRDDNFNYSGKLGPALSFNGVEEALTINDSSSLDLVTDFSISFWAYPTSLARNMTFLSKGSGTTATNYFIDYKTTNQLEFGFYNGGFKSILVNGSSVVANQWNMITATWNETSNMSKVYINGIEKGSLQINYNILANALDLKVGMFPGYNQNFTGLIDELIIYNKTLNSSDVTNIYQLKSQNWYWKFSGQDSGGITMSSTRSFLVGSIWDVSPTDFGTVSTTLNTNVSVGTLFINNTHGSKNVTINITYDYNGTVVFNHTLPLNLTNSNWGNNSINIQVNVTSPATEGSTTITFNITATDTNTGGNSVPTSRLVSVDLVATQGNPFLITNFETIPSIVSQNNTGISLTASVKNSGQGNAQNVKITYELPSGWTNLSGALTSNAFLLNVNEQQNYSITVDIASNATSGIVTLYANVTGQNSTGSDIGNSLKTIGTANVTVNEVSTGAGPSTATTATTTATVSGGGGGGGVSVPVVIYAKTIEMVRGQTNTFGVEIVNKYSNTTLYNLTLKLEGFPAQYISISPSIISKLDSGKKINFTITLTAPIYKSYEEHNLKATIQGIKIQDGKDSVYNEIQNIKLIIQEVEFNETAINLAEAEKAIELMKKNGFFILDVKSLLEQARLKLGEGKNKDAFDLANKILEIKNKAFEADKLIGEVFGLLVDPKNPESYLDRESRDAISGRVIFASSSVENLLDLAKVAFDRGDYTTAFDRAMSARVLLSLERKGNFWLFMYLYWHFVFLAIIGISFSGMVGYRKYQKYSISKKIDDLNNEEKNIRNLFLELQKKYFGGKISEGDYKYSTKQNNKRMARIKKIRLDLRSRRIKLLAPRRILNELEIERMQVEAEIKKLQTGYYVDKIVNTQEYRFEFGALNERIAEIEDERATIELLNEKKKISRTNIPEKTEVSFDKFPETIKREKSMFAQKGRIKVRKIFRNFLENILKVKQKISSLFKKMFARDSMRKNQRGVMLVDNNLLDLLKRESEKNNFKDRYIGLNRRKNEK